MQEYEHILMCPSGVFAEYSSILTPLPAKPRCWKALREKISQFSYIDVLKGIKCWRMNFEK